jgi:hypothetical protein
MAEPPTAPEPAEPARDDRGALRYVEQALRGLRFGAVTIIIQDGVIVQVERTERRRFQRGGTSSPRPR